MREQLPLDYQAASSAKTSTPEANKRESASVYFSCRGTLEKVWLPKDAGSCIFSLSFSVFFAHVGRVGARRTSARIQDSMLPTIQEIARSECIVHLLWFGPHEAQRVLWTPWACIKKTALEPLLLQSVRRVNVNRSYPTAGDEKLWKALAKVEGDDRTLYFSYDTGRWGEELDAAKLAEINGTKARFAEGNGWWQRWSQKRKHECTSAHCLMGSKSPMSPMSPSAKSPMSPMRPIRASVKSPMSPSAKSPMSAMSPSAKSRSAKSPSPKSPMSMSPMSATR